MGVEMELQQVSINLQSNEV